MYFRFENLEVWKLARNFVNSIYRVTKTFPRDELFSLTRQLRRAALSILLNIAEGSGRGSDKEFVRFLRIAKASLEEVVAALYISLDQTHIDKITFDGIYSDSNLLAGKLNALINYLRRH